jgi:hypothetical protein
MGSWIFCQNKEHLDTLDAMGNLASTYQDLGKWKDAEELEA